VLYPHHRPRDQTPEQDGNENVVFENGADTTGDKNRYYKRYFVSDLTDQFLLSEIAQNEILLCIERQMTYQREIDSIYDQFCKIYYDEMDKNLRFKNVNKKAKKRHRQLKPFWNDELSFLWNIVREYENKFLKAPQNSAMKRSLQIKFFDAQKDFDKKYGKAKRRFQEKKMIDIEMMNTEDPKAFWQELKKLGPQRSNEILIAVYNDDGSVCNYFINY
jgi:hypothetical protein